MKQYTGTKTVKAVPMTYGEAHERGLIRENAYVEEYNDNKGYHVIYPDGYESWSPAEVFEDAYKLSETPLDRLNIEIADLKQKADKLGAFIFNKNDGKDFKALPLGTRAFLIAQFNTMCAYLNLAALSDSRVWRVTRSADPPASHSSKSYPCSAKAFLSAAQDGTAKDSWCSSKCRPTSLRRLFRKCSHSLMRPSVLSLQVATTSTTLLSA